MTPWKDRVVPIAMELVSLDVKISIHVLLHFDSDGVVFWVQDGPYLEPLSRGGVGNQIDNHLMAGEGVATPVLGDVAKHPVFDLIPLAGPRRKVAHADAQAGLICESLEFRLPEVTTVIVAATRICCDE